MKMLISVLLIACAAFVFFKQQNDRNRLEQEFLAQVSEARNHNFIIPPIPEKDPTFSLSEADLKKARRQAFQQKNTDASVKAIEQLWKLQDKDAIPAIKNVFGNKYLECYNSCSRVVLHKLSLIDFVSRDHSKVNMKLLMSVAKDKDSSVRAAAVSALGQYLCNDVIATLQNAMSDRNQEVAKAAGISFDSVFHGMKQWRENRINELVSEYAKKISPLDREKGEKKLRMLIEQHDNQEKEKAQ